MISLLNHTVQTCGYSTANQRIDRIHTIAKSLNHKSYLEVGVFTGSTFLHINLPYKVGVDPAFRFDIKTVQSESVILESTTSDNYFANVPMQQTFDFVFLDGLHHFEQTYRDLCNTLLHTHIRSVIMIDDVRPNDPYSTLTDQQKCVQLRLAAGGNPNDQRWHGDVYKTVFAIHDFYPSLDYATMHDVNNPQLLLWRSKAFKRKPIFNNLEHISRMSYFDLLEYEYLMRITTEHDAVNRCITALNQYQ